MYRECTEKHLKASKSIEKQLQARLERSVFSATPQSVPSIDAEPAFPGHFSSTPKGDLTFNGFSQFLESLQARNG